MNRREFLNRSTAATLSLGLSRSLLADPSLAASAAASTLPQTAPLTEQGDLAMRMVDGIRSYLLRETARQAAARHQFWNRNYLSAARYTQSVEPNRQSLRRIIGAVDPRAAVQPPELMVRFDQQPEIAHAPGYKIYAIRWRVFDPVTADSDGMHAEGLLLQPPHPVARVVALPDADCTPEMLTGLAPGVPAPAQFARRLAASGIQVVVPLLISRDDTFSGIPGIAMTNMPHREWIYRMAFEAGRHIIGFEVQSALAMIDWFERENSPAKLPIGVIGYGEGGLLALYSGAIDTRIDAVAVSGYFQPREALWAEPIYRDLWGLLREFGDAELASLIAPRSLVVEACRAPEISAPPPATNGRLSCACPNGTLTTPSPGAVRQEFDRAAAFFRKLNAGARLHFVSSDSGHGLPGSTAALEAFLQSLGLRAQLAPASIPAPTSSVAYDPQPRLHRQFNQIVDFTQALIRKSPDTRQSFWKNADASSVASWKTSTEFYRNYIWDEVIGRMPAPSLAPNPRTRLILDEPAFTGYEVMLDVWPDVFACGILLVPKDLRPGERRPVVVCQHGLEGRASDVADPSIDDHFYHHFGATLANQGFIVYAPQNPYIGQDRFRIIQRLGHPLKLALFSFIIGQHQQTLDWLAALPFVDPARIGFYGLSYGGKTAVRLPPLLDRYALSICSGDFNEWVWKTTTVLDPQSYLLTAEYDMYEFNFANVLNYADLANLIAPRPFMVERGHNDGVSVDQWVAYEYAFVRQFYDKLNLGDQTRIEFFNGPHTIHGVGTFEFLRHHLHWPESA
jgi:dienelactone hydrolase